LGTALKKRIRSLRLSTLGGSCAFLGYLPNLTSLSIMLSDWSGVEFVNALPHLSHLRALEVWGLCSVLTPDILPRHCPKLEHFSECINCFSADKVLNALGQMSELKSIRIHVDAPNDWPPLQKIADKGKLEFIHISSCQAPADVVQKLLRKCKVGGSNIARNNTQY
jgi:hypothetical protein